MNEDHISRPEFDLFMKITSEAAKKTAEAITKLAEYTIKHDGEHIEINRRMTDQGKMIVALNEAILATQQVTSFWKTVGKYGKYSLIGALTVIGAYFGKEWFNIK